MFLHVKPKATHQRLRHQPKMLISRSIYLTGYRACGKTTVAKMLSASIEIPWIDMDAEIVRTAGQTISQMFEDKGEQYFRDLESEQLSLIADGPVRIVSLGGGAILRNRNRNIIKRSGLCIWLDASPQQIIARLQADHATAEQRPSLTDQSVTDEVVSILNQRRPIYSEVADHRIDTDDKSPETVADEAKKLIVV